MKANSRPKSIPSSHSKSSSSSKLRITEGGVEELECVEKKSKPNKKRRILLRDRQKKKDIAEEARRKERDAKEEAEREKRTRRNREKKVKRKMREKEKARKVDVEGEGSGEVGGGNGSGSVGGDD